MATRSVKASGTTTSIPRRDPPGAPVLRLLPEYHKPADRDIESGGTLQSDRMRWFLMSIEANKSTAKCENAHTGTRDGLRLPRPATQVDAKGDGPPARARKLTIHISLAP